MPYCIEQILNITVSRRLSVFDTERAVQINSYDNCAYNGRERGALATDPITPYYAASAYVNGKGITLYDLRMPLPLDFHFDVLNFSLDCSFCVFIFIIYSFLVSLRSYT